MCLAEVPSFRVDIKREADLIEEVCRLFGVDKIPSTTPRGTVGSNSFDSVYDQYVLVRRLLTSFGVNEAQGQTLISDDPARVTLGEKSVPVLIHLKNPLSSDMNVLRPSLVPGLLESLSHNVHHQSRDLRLFEVGRVFSRNEGETREERRIALALTGHRSTVFWTGLERESKLNIFDLKGILEEFFDQLGVRGVQYERDEKPDATYLESATLLIGKQPAGKFGQLNPVIGRRYDLRDPALIGEFNLDFILQRRNQSRAFKSLALFPAIRRDVAMLVDESITHERVLNTVKQAKAPHLERTELFDIYRGKGVPENRKSMAYAFVYRHPEKTLTESEVNSSHEKVVARLKSELAAEMRA